MIKIIGKRGSGKTTRLLKIANESNAMILTANSRALREKAKNLGYSRDLEIIGFGDLERDNYSFNKNVLVDDIEAILQYLLERYYGLKVEGFSTTLEDENDNKR